ncbi:MAG: UPF0149 family protein [Luminiphilus sp.]|nr:UPF0149 family protein [Luminiphilus sp.]
MPDWSEAADVLLGMGLTLNPSELHGALLGTLGAGQPLASELDFDRALSVLEKALAVDLQGEVAEFVKRLAGATVSAVRDTDFAFTPLLPDDEEEFHNRLTSLGSWAAGFLTGFTQAVSAAQAASEAIDPSAAEALKDFAAIAQIDVDESESDEAERELEELVEYVRMAALNIVIDALNEQEE